MKSKIYLIYAIIAIVFAIEGLIAYCLKGYSEFWGDFL